jgi:uncharacterized membrane protein YkvA (DUF1232 family)
MSRAIEIYRELCEDLPRDALKVLRGDVRAHLDTLTVAQRQSEFVAVDLAEMLCDRLEALLDAAPRMTATDREAVVGAARYFVSRADAAPDEASCTGLDDDVEVFNFVVTLLERKDLLINE